MNLNQQIHNVKQRIIEACERSGRRPEDIKLVAVTKTLPVELIKQAHDAGLRIFGESRAQELRDKIPSLPENIEWHFIGHLQKNKIKYVLPWSVLIHSVDSLHLAQAISQYSEKNNICPDILLEVNTSKEETKFGIGPKEAIRIFQKIKELPHLNLKGLMTIAPFTEDESLVRTSFKTLVKIKDNIQNKIGFENKFYDSIICDISRNGCFIENCEPLNIGQIIKLVLPGTKFNQIGKLKVEVVRLSPIGVGVKFKSIIKKASKK